jgi:hypothetical protein
MVYLLTPAVLYIHPHISFTWQQSAPELAQLGATLHLRDSGVAGPVTTYKVTVKTSVDSRPIHPCEHVLPYRRNNSKLFNTRVVTKYKPSKSKLVLCCIPMYI